MKKITLLTLLAVFVLSNVWGQMIPGASQNLHKIKHQKSLELRSSPWDTYVMPDSVVIRNHDGLNLTKVVFVSYEERKELNDYYGWNAEAGAWTAPTREEINYNEDGNVTDTIYSTNVAGGWVPYLKINQTYNEKGVLIGKFVYIKNAEGSLALNEEYTIASTFVEGSETQVASAIYTLKAEDGVVNDCKYDYEYDASGNVLSRVYSNWDAVANDWAAFDRTQYTYNEDGLQIEEIYFEWLPEVMAWSSIQKWVYFYDGKVKNKMAYVNYYRWENSINNWTPDWVTQFMYYYDGSSAGIESVTKSNAKIWAYDQTVYIESETNLASVSIYNTTGNLLYQQTAKGNTIVFTSPVRNGIYLVKVKEISGKSKTAKLIIR